MRLAPPAHRAYTYTVTAPPANLAVELCSFKNHIKKTNNSENGLLTLYLEAAIKYAEQATGRELITRTYQTFRDFFPHPSQNEGYYPYGRIPSHNSFITSFEDNVGFEIRKSPLREVTSIEYYVDGVLTTVDPATYYHTIETDYSEILVHPNQDWPENADRRQQSVVITFTAGYGNSESDIPSDIRNAILEHATAMWANRGDCDDGCSAAAPAQATAAYKRNRILNL